MPNRLATQSSLYLRQHMNNPVDWYPWGPEAHERARSEDRPIVLSVGYAACHWCHVMEHECFEDPGVAELMNGGFVSIKVDREERPDVDHLYMTACHLFTGSGGWPLTVFLTPQLHPFFAGTYFPREDRYGRPGFRRVLTALADAWRTQRDEVEEQARRFMASLEDLAQPPPAPPLLGLAPSAGGAPLEEATRALLKRHDAHNGGFGGAPKFPNTLDLMLLELAARKGNTRAGQAVTLTCRKMMEGGIHDQLGGGFHRYSVDAAWQVPHFEKMLYDNALIPAVLLAAYRRTAEPWLAQTVGSAVGWLQREMVAPHGGFYATQDADSEGKEGKFFCFTPAEVEAELTEEDARAFCLRHGVTEEGNFTVEEHAHPDAGTRSNVLHIAATAEEVAAQLGLAPADVEASLERARKTLLVARQRRVAPARDEKILAGWNGLMAAALCDAAATLERPEWLALAKGALEFVLSAMRHPDGGLYRSFAGDRAHIDGLLEDHAFVATACLAAHRAGAGAAFLTHALTLCELMVSRFHDAADPGFFSTRANAADLVVRARSLHDDAVPAAASLACQALLAVGSLCARPDLMQVADGVLARAQGVLQRRPTAVATLVAALERAGAGNPVVVVSAGHGQTQMLGLVRRLCDAWVAVVDGAADAGVVSPELLSGKDPVQGAAAAYVCAGNTCQAPATTQASLRQALAAAGLLAAAPHAEC